MLKRIITLMGQWLARLICCLMAWGCVAAWAVDISSGGFPAQTFHADTFWVDTYAATIDLSGGAPVSFTVANAHYDVENWYEFMDACPQPFNEDTCLISMPVTVSLSLTVGGVTHVLTQSAIVHLGWYADDITGYVDAPPVATTFDLGSGGVVSVALNAFFYNSGYLGTGDFPLTATFTRGGAVNSPIAQAYFIHSDQLDTPRVITDGNGAVVWTWYNADPFGGGSLPNQDPNSTGNVFTFNPRFPGQYFDNETNLHYNYFRDYDPGTGRYLESDLIGFIGGINTYLYVLGNPISYTDPKGLEVQICCRPAQIAGGLINHCWVQTGTISAGMGADPNVPPGQQYEGYGMPVQITNHANDTPAQCTPQKNVNEQCVNNKLQIGKPIGRFLPPFNQCQSFAYGTVNSCRTGPAQ